MREREFGWFRRGRERVEKGLGGRCNYDLSLDDDNRIPPTHYRNTVTQGHQNSDGSTAPGGRAFLALFSAM